MTDSKRQKSDRSELVPHSYRRRHREPHGMVRATSRQVHADFDSTTWSAMLEEQRLAIARAAGVDPAKVRIQIGH